MFTGLVTPVSKKPHPKHARDRGEKGRKQSGRGWHAPGHDRDQARAGPPGLLHGRAVLTVDCPPVTHGREEAPRLTAHPKRNTTQA